MQKKAENTINNFNHLQGAVTAHGVNTVRTYRTCPQVFHVRYKKTVISISWFTAVFDTAVLTSADCKYLKSLSAQSAGFPPPKGGNKNVRYTAPHTHFFPLIFGGRGQMVQERKDHEMNPTWQKLTELEPRLVGVLHEAQAVTDDPGKPSFCANRVWYGYDEPGPGPRGLKGKISALVGWHSTNPEHPVLGSEEAYSIAYRTVYDALPDCRNCFCA